MLKVELNKETHVADIRATGTVLDITSDVAYLIQTLYNELAPEVRTLFRDAISEFVNNPKSPAWGVETGAEDGILCVTIRLQNPEKEE